MLFTLNTLKISRMASGATKNNILEQKRFYRPRMTFSQSLLVTDGKFKLDYIQRQCDIRRSCSSSRRNVT